MWQEASGFAWTGEVLVADPEKDFVVRDSWVSWYEDDKEEATVELS